jgi:UDP-glucose 4-epimerase
VSLTENVPHEAIDPTTLDYSGRTCLITGGAGFIGSHLAEELVARGASVYVVDDLSSGWLANLGALPSHPRFRFYEGNVGSFSFLEELVERSEEIYHLAAAVGVEYVLRKPVETVARNLYPTERLLQLAAESGSKLFLASSSEVYGQGAASPMDESDPPVLAPPDKTRYIYALTKLLTEYLALAYHRQYGLKVVVGRFFNVVGPRQSGQYGMVIPRMVERALRTGTIQVHDDGNQVRCFMHVRDAVLAMLGLMNHPAAVGEVVNIGSDVPVTIREVAQRVAELLGQPVRIEYIPYEKAYGPGFQDVRCRVPSVRKLHALVRLPEPQGLHEIIRDVIEFQRQHL